MTGDSDARGHWKIESAARGTAGYLRLLAQGWEPFAVDHSTVWFRRFVPHEIRVTAGVTTFRGTS